jgi:large subunit ribosomal protein L10
MPNIEEKSLVVSEIKEKMQKSSGIVLADYRGLTVAEVTKLRTQLRQAGVEYRVMKNSLVQRAADEVGVEGLEPYLKGPTAFAFSTDPVAPAKVIADFVKANKLKTLKIKAGVLEGKVIDPEGVKALADLPSREVLLTMVVRAMQGPLTGMANVLQGPIRKMGYALEEVRKLKEAQ